MSGRSLRHLIVLLTVVLATSLFASVPSHMAGAVTARGSWVAYVTDAQVPMHTNVSRSTLHALIAKAKPTLAHTSTKSPSTVVQPLTVASGYTLYHPGYVSGCTNNKCYIYNSDSHYMNLDHCTVDGCTLSAQVKSQVRESVRGGKSKYWDLTENAFTVTNPGRQSWTYTAIYYCAVNISGAPDHYCGNQADASGTEAPMTPGETVGKRFENVSGNTVYPMVGIMVHFKVGQTVLAPFREWDVCNRATVTALCPSSGNGS